MDTENGRLNSLSEELRNERSKSSNALSECARLKIQLNSLNSKIQDLTSDSENYKKLYEENVRQMYDLESNLEEAVTENQSLHESVDDKDKNIQILTEDVYQLQSQNDSTLKICEIKDAEIKSMRTKLDALQTSTTNREIAIERLTLSEAQLRAALKETERQKLDLDQQVSELNDINHNLNLELDQLRSANERLNSAAVDNEDLRINYHEAVAENENLHSDIRFLKKKLQSITAAFTHNDELGSSLLAEKNSLRDKLDALESSYEKQSATISTLEDVIEQLNQTKRNLLSEIDDFKDRYQNSLQVQTEFDSNMKEANLHISELHAELTKYKDRIHKLESELANSSPRLEINEVIARLTEQLRDTRKIVTDYEDQEKAKSLQPSSSSKDHETIRHQAEAINALRATVTQAHSDCRKLTEELHTARVQSTNLSIVSSERDRFREQSVSSANALKKADLEVSRANERVTQLNDDIQRLKHQILVIESDLSNSRASAENSHRDVAILEQKLEVMSVAALNKDGELAEMRTGFYSQRNTIEEQHHMIRQLETTQTNLKKTVQELRHKVEHLQSCEKELLFVQTQHKKDGDELKHLRATLNNATTHSADELRRLDNEVSNLTAELRVCRNNETVHRQHIQELTEERNSLVSQIDAAHADRERYAREIAETEIQERIHRENLRRDLEEIQSIKEREVETNKQFTDLQNHYSKECQANALLKKDLDLMSQRLETVLQELKVFKSVDVYHTAMQMELQSYRRDKESVTQQQTSALKHSNDGYSFSSSSAIKNSSLRGQSLFGNSAAKGKLTLSDMDASRHEHSLIESGRDFNSRPLLPSSLSGGITPMHPSLSASMSSRQHPPLHPHHGRQMPVPPPPPPSTAAASGAASMRRPSLTKRDDEDDVVSILSTHSLHDQQRLSLVSGADSSSEDDNDDVEDHGNKMSLHKRVAVAETKSQDLESSMVAKASNSAAASQSQHNEEHIARLKRKADRDKRLLEEVRLTAAANTVRVNAASTSSSKSQQQRDAMGSSSAANRKAKEDNYSEDNMSQSSRHSTASQISQRETMLPDRGRGLQRSQAATSTPILDVQRVTTTSVSESNKRQSESTVIKEGLAGSISVPTAKRSMQAERPTVAELRQFYALRK